MSDATLTIRIPADLREQVDERVRTLDLDRSKYFRRLLREDLSRALCVTPSQPVPRRRRSKKEVAP